MMKLNWCDGDCDTNDESTTRLLCVLWSGLVTLMFLGVGEMGNKTIVYPFINMVQE
jgi:hypothetical protein